MLKQLSDRVNELETAAEACLLKQRIKKQNYSI